MGYLGVGMFIIIVALGVALKVMSSSRDEALKRLYAAQATISELNEVDRVEDAVNRAQAVMRRENEEYEHIRLNQKIDGNIYFGDDRLQKH